LNEITLNPNLLRVVSQLMDVPIHRIRITQSACFAKRGPDETQLNNGIDSSNHDVDYFENGNQPIHQDFGNNTLLTVNTSNKPVEVQAMLYYNDFEDVGGGTSFVPGLSHTSANPFHLGWLPDAKDMMIHDDDSCTKEIDPRPALYNAERIAAYSVGSILFYTLGTWHRGTSVYPGCMRRVQHLCFRRDDAYWIGGSEEFGQPTTNSLLKCRIKTSSKYEYESKINLAGLSSEQRSVLGFPFIQSKYWNNCTIRETSLMHEGTLDLSLYTKSKE